MTEASTEFVVRRVADRKAYLDVEIATIQAQLATIQQRTSRVQADAEQYEDRSAGAELTKLRAKRTQLVERLDGVLKLKNSIDGWLQRVGPLELSKLTGIKVPRGTAALEQAVSTIRDEIDRLKGELAKVQRTPVKLDDLHERVRRHVDELAKLGAPPTCNVTASGQVNIDFSTVGYSKPPVCYLAWLFPDQMTDRLVEQIEGQHAHRGHAMSIGEKEQQIDDLTATLDKAERKEVILVDAAIEAGLSNITHRANVSIPAFLQVRPLREPQRTALAVA